MSDLLFALDLEPDADGIVLAIRNQTGAHPRVYSAELIASPQVAWLCIATGDRFVYQQSLFLYPLSLQIPTRFWDPQAVALPIQVSVTIKRFSLLTFLMGAIDCSPNELWELKAWTGAKEETQQNWSVWIEITRIQMKMKGLLYVYYRYLCSV